MIVAFANCAFDIGLSGDMTMAGFQEPLGHLLWECDHTVCIADHDVAWQNHAAADRHRDVYRAGTILERSMMGGSPRDARKIVS
jgi:hypothetical protein